MNTRTFFIVEPDGTHRDVVQEHPDDSIANIPGTIAIQIHPHKTGKLFFLISHKFWGTLFEDSKYKPTVEQKTVLMLHGL